MGGAGIAGAGGGLDRRLSTVARLAQLLEAHLEPEDVQRYFYVTPVEALDGSTFAVATEKLDDDDLDKAVDGLAGALVW